MSFRLERPDKEEYYKKVKEFMEYYSRIFGKEISYSELVEVLEGKREIYPLTYNLVKLLEELNELYWKLKSLGVKLPDPKASP